MKRIIETIDLLCGDLKPRTAKVIADVDASKVIVHEVTAAFTVGLARETLTIDENILPELTLEKLEAIKQAIRLRHIGPADHVWEGDVV